MNTLFMRVQGAMQSWGDSGNWQYRNSRYEPTKSGIIGIISASLGIHDDDERIRLLSSSLKMGVRVDQQGHKPPADYHTTYRTLDADGNIKGVSGVTTAHITRREYLHDAAFLVAIQGESKLLEEIANALKNPVFPTFLGRKCCPPSFPHVPVIPGVDYLGQYDNVESALKSHIAITERQPNYYRALIDTTPGQDTSRSICYLRNDVPISFRHRFFGQRQVYEIKIPRQEISQNASVDV